MSRRCAFLCFAIVAIYFLSIVASAKIIRCKGPHEVYACGSYCQTTCDTLGQPCPIVNIVCNNGCYCEDGYARNRNNICIPIAACNNNSEKTTPVVVY